MVNKICVNIEVARAAVAAGQYFEETQLHSLRAYVSGLLGAAMWLALVAHGSAQQDLRAAAMAHERAGDNAAASDEWMKLSAAFPRVAEPYAHLGLIAAREQKYADAIRYYRKALELGPKMPALEMNLALALFKNGEYREAITIFESLRPAASGDELQRLTILDGMARYGARDYRGAWPLLSDAAEHDPSNLELQLALANACLLDRKFECVGRAFHQMLALNAESAEVDMLMGEALDAMNERPAAIEKFRAAERVNPKQTNVHFGLGYLLWMDKNFPEAADEFARELANDPAHMQAAAYRANALIEMSRTDEAEALLISVVRQDPSIAMAHRDLGILWMDAGRKSEALGELETAAKLAPKDVNTHWRLGRLYRSLGRVSEAKAEFDRANTLNKEADAGLLNVMTRVGESRK